MAILFKVGCHHEQPSIVRSLLSVSENPCKPVYTPASDTPLVLYDCVFPGVTFPGEREPIAEIFTRLSEAYVQRMNQSAMLWSMLNSIQSYPMRPADSIRPTFVAAKEIPVDEESGMLKSGRFVESIEARRDKLSGGRKRRFEAKKQRTDTYEEAKRSKQLTDAK